ncbi:MAG: ABC transporter permease [Acidobacteriota bacterium]|jgi:ABC-2 type transport system permease protein
MFDRLRHMLIKEFIQTLKDPRMRSVIIVVPIVQMIIFGYAVTTDVRNIQLGVQDLDNSVQSRTLLHDFTSSGYFHIVKRISSAGEVRGLMDSGKVQALIRIDHGFADKVLGGKTATVQMLLDGTDSNTISIAMSYASRILARYNGRIIFQDLSRDGPAPDRRSAVDLDSRAWFNGNLESRDYYVPGVLALLLMVVVIMLSSMAIVREREIGTMEQLMVTPIRRWEFILGKTIPFGLIGLLDVLLISAVALFWFKVPLRGSVFLLLAGTVVYLMSMLGVGLLISTVSRTQQQAMMTAFFFNLPAVLLSGFFYPIHNMPGIVQVLTYADPLRYFIVVVRGIFLKGVGIGILWPQFLALAALGTLLLFTATKRFHKTMS